MLLLLSVLTTSPILAAPGEPLSISDARFVPGKEAAAVAAVVGGIISFTRWPTESSPLHLCVVGTTFYAARLGEASRRAGRSISVRTLAAGGSTDGCDVLYMGAMPAATARQMIASIRARPVLSIAEADPACRGGSMFCLKMGRESLSFQLSVDAVSRGTVRIDPRVLRIVGSGDGG